MSTTRIAVVRATPAKMSGKLTIVQKPGVEESPADGVLDDAAAASAPPRRTTRKRARTFAAAGAVALAALGALGALYAGRTDPAPDAKDAPHQGSSAGERLRRVDLGVHLPTGWREASDAELGSAQPLGSTVVFRGATPADPDHGLFVATAALDADLVSAARTAERGVISQLGIETSSYHPSGCLLVALGASRARAGKCRGVAAHRGASVAVEVYVRAVGPRNVVALSLAKPSQPAAAVETAAIVASFTP